MASKMVREKSCDACSHIGLSDVPAQASHTISIDGGPVRNLDFCPSDELRLFGVLASVYQHEGQDLKREAERHKELAKKRMELTAVPEDPQESQQDTASGVRIRCPLPHSSSRGTKPVSYRTRSSHAKIVHNLGSWEIAWEYPDDIPWVPCSVHQVCKENGYRLLNQQGLKQHIFACTEERIN